MTLRRNDPNHKFFRRPCRKCTKMFRPTGKFSYTCPKCLKRYETWHHNTGKNSKEDYKEYLKKLKGGKNGNKI